VARADDWMDIWIKSGQGITFGQGLGIIVVDSNMHVEVGRIGAGVHGLDGGEQAIYAVSGGDEE